MMHGCHSSSTLYVSQLQSNICDVCPHKLDAGPSVMAAHASENMHVGAVTAATEIFGSIMGTKDSQIRRACLIALDRDFQ